METQKKNLAPGSQEALNRCLPCSGTYFQLGNPDSRLQSQIDVLEQITKSLHEISMERNFLCNSPRTMKPLSSQSEAAICMDNKGTADGHAGMADEESNNALLAACADGTLTESTLQRLLQGGASLSTRARSGDNVITLAVKAGSLRACKALMTGPHNLLMMANGQGNDRSALNLALKLKHTTIAKFLLERRADVTRKGCNGDTALIHASRNNNIEIAREVLSRGADINTQDRYGVTALHVAVYKGNAKTVKFLLDMKADATIVNKKNRTALQNAEKSSQRADVASILRDHHVNLGEGVEREVKVKEEREDEGDEDDEDDDDDDGGVSCPPPLIPNSVVASARERVPTHAPIPALACIPSSAFASAPPAPPFAFASVPVPVPVPVSAPFSVPVPVPAHVPVLAHVPAHVPAPETAPEAASKPVSIPVCVPVSAPFSVSTPTSLMGKRKRKTDSSAATPPRATDGGGDLVNLLLGMRTMTPGSGNATTSPTSTKVKPTATTAARLRARRSTAGVGGASEVASILKRRRQYLQTEGTDDVTENATQDCLVDVRRSELNNNSSEAQQSAADFDSQIDPSESLLAACRNGSLTSAKLRSLIARDASIFARCANGDTALMLAVRSGSTTACEALVAHNTHIVNVVNWQNNDRCPLLLALKLRHTAIATLLIRHRADVNTKFANQSTALIHAANENNTEIAKLLLAHDANINDIDGGGVTALRAASNKGHTAIVQLLLEMKADASTIMSEKKTKKTKPPPMAKKQKKKSEAAGGGTSKTKNLPSEEAAKKSKQRNIAKVKTIVSDAAEAANRALLHACEDGSLTQAKLQSLLRSNADANKRNSNSYTTLMLAVKGRSLDVCSVLVNHNPDIINFCCRQASHRYALNFALRLNQTRIAKLLLEHRADVNKKGGNRETALIHAARNNNTEIARLLLARGADIDHRNTYGISPLNAAAVKGHVETVELLLNSKANPSLLNEKDKFALIASVSCTRKAQIVMLLELASGVEQKESKPDSQDDFSGGCGKKITAKSNGKDTRGEINLQKSKMNTEKKKKANKSGTQPNHILLAACKDGSLTQPNLQFLLERKADVFARAKYSDTTLMLAVRAGSVHACEALLSLDLDIVNVYCKKATHRYALNHAVFMNDDTLSRLLINHRADVNKRGGNRNTALIHAARNGNLELARLLLNHRARINNKNASGITALHAAANRGNVAAPMVKFLLEAKADARIENSDNKTALMSSSSKGSQSATVTALLMCHNNVGSKKRGVSSNDIVVPAMSPSPPKRKRISIDENANDVINTGKQLLVTKRRKVSITGGHDDNSGRKIDHQQIESVRREVAEMRKFLNLRAEEGEKQQSEVQAIRKHIDRLMQMTHRDQTNNVGRAHNKQNLATEIHQLKKVWQSDLDTQTEKVDRQREEIKLLKTTKSEQGKRITSLMDLLKEERRDNKKRITELTKALEQQSQAHSYQLSTIKQHIDQEKKHHCHDLNEICTLRVELAEMKKLMESIRKV